jgi:hypothetical protein
MIIKDGSLLWQYLSVNQKALARDGEFLIEDSKIHTDAPPTDFSYLVFPFAKLYEGFLKQLFLDLEIIRTSDYDSDHFRIGKVLSPNLARRLGQRSAYTQISTRFGKGLADDLWYTWKQARNLVFHYFPHNLRSLTRDQAVELVAMIVSTMEAAVRLTRVRPQRSRPVDVRFVGSSKWHHG